MFKPSESRSNSSSVRDIPDLDRQLLMYARIKELYNIDFETQVKEIEGRIARRRPRKRKSSRLRCSGPTWD